LLIHTGLNQFDPLIDHLSECNTQNGTTFASNNSSITDIGLSADRQNDFGGGKLVITNHEQTCAI
jgi:hypothetical protein